MVLKDKRQKKRRRHMKNIIRNLLTKQITLGSMSIKAGTIVATALSVAAIGGAVVTLAVTQPNDSPVQTVNEIITEEQVKEETKVTQEQEAVKDELINQNGETDVTATVAKEEEYVHQHVFNTEISCESSCTTQGEAVDTCAECGYYTAYSLPLKEHTAGEWIVSVAATETTEGVKEQYCNECGNKLATEVIPIVPHTHNYVVSGSKAASCVEKGYTLYACVVCNSSYTTSIEAKGHNYSEEIVEEATFEKEGHIYKKCSDCGDIIQTGTISKKEHTYGEWEVTKEVTCTEDGEKKRICSICGIEDIAIIKAEGHKFSNYEVITEATEENEGLEKAICDNCEAEDERTIAKLPHVHDYTTEIERVEPTCTEDGYYVLQCRCESTLRTDISALGHSYELSGHADATCILDGKDTYTCSECEDTYSDIIPATGHSSGDWEITEEPTDLADGEKVRKCTECGTILETQIISKLPHTCEQTKLLEKQEETCTTDGYELYECRCGLTDKVILPKTNHADFEWKTIKDATYTEMGLEQKICKDCGYVIESKDIAVLPHEHDYKITESVNPKCTENGKTVETCSICGNTKTEVLQATGHKESAFIIDKEATCLTTGEQHTECNVCHIVLKEETIAATGHTEGDWVIDSDASCTNDGSKHTVCVSCGATISTETLFATGHTMGDWGETSGAGCESNGSEARNCSNCSYSESRSIPALGHNYGDWIIDVEATEENEGSKHKECSRCDSIITEEIEQLPPHAHNYSETSRTDSTCSQVGSVTYTCGCGDSYSEEIAKKAHTPGEWTITTPATEDSTGLEVRNCTECGIETDSRIIEKLEHVHTYNTENKEATCTEDGYEKQTCSCGSVINTIIPATGHKYGKAVVVEPTCEEKGTFTIACEICSHKEVTEIETTGHNYVESEKEAATCEKAGSITYKCSNCEAAYSEEIEKLEHEYKVTSTIEATCTGGGYSIETCKYCGDTKKVDETEALGHDDGEWIVIKEAELGVAGSKELQCTACDAVLDTEEIEMLLTDGTDSVYYFDVKYEDGTYGQEFAIGHYNEEEAKEMLTLINAHRESIDMPTFTMSNSYMAEYTNLRAVETSYLWDHTRPAKYGTECAENIAMSGVNAWGETADVEAIYNAWMESAGHKSNIEASRSYNMTGISVFYKRCPVYGANDEVIRYVYEAYWVQTFR